MADAIRAFDWSGTSIGGIDTWSPALKTIVEMAVHSKQAICLVWGADLNFIYNDTYARFLGVREMSALGQPFEQVWADVWDDIAPIVLDALSGNGSWFENMKLIMTRKGYEEETYWSFSYSPLYGMNGRVAGMINIATETTDAVVDRQALSESVAEAQRKLELQACLDAQHRVIQREMAHRIKNMLSMTMAVVSQSLRHAQSLDEAGRTISHRIAALSNAQDLLVSTREATTDVRTIIHQTLNPYQTSDDRIHLTGPDIAIQAQQALGLALAIHELATNAVKYGALSSDAGTVEVSWKLDDNQLELIWVEQGGPPAVQPTRGGFGSRLLSRIVPSYFHGEAHQSYEASGFRYAVSGKISEEVMLASETNTNERS
ncbi:PAS domain-containing protein [Rhizobium sp. DKSPLA3]|uniref:histidine kinase n=1 Tax=Rhizobium quercicola TaxID=2901226 RepID=A0A9X1NTH2_9HYPH|nr:PAS domain-containing sensor histidine kinase [Rhizobium quercicola]MCD7109399.1 PAS domain-containing protein [Rhizobium quercicola]